MRLALTLILALAASSAAARDYGSWAPSEPWPGSAARKPGYHIPSPERPAAPRRAAGTPPEAPAFKRYQPPSVYSRPKNWDNPGGAKPCETSVFVDACDRR